MVLLALEFKCELKGLESVSLSSSARLNVKVRFPSGETHDNVWVDRDESVEIPGGKGTANLLIKDKLSGNVASISGLDAKGSYPEYKDGDGWKTFAVLDCRGVEVTEWVINDEGFTAKNAGGDIEDVEFDDGEFYGYDEKNDEDTSITETQTRVVASSGKKKKKGKRK